MTVMPERHVNGTDTYMYDMGTKPVILSNNLLTMQLPELGDHLQATTKYICIHTGYGIVKSW